MAERKAAVTVLLVGGELDGVEADAPRDEAGRVLNEIWVGTSPPNARVVARAEPTDDSREGTPALYRLESWRGQHPVYQWVPQATWFRSEHQNRD